jgi:hypothetical protein
LPEKKSERKSWIDNLDHFKRLVVDMYENKELLKTVGLGFLTDEWFEENQKLKPGEFIENVKNMVVAVYNRTEIEQVISTADLEIFKEATKSIIENTLNPYLQLFSNPIDNEHNSYYIPGIRGILEKNAFAEDKEADYGNHNSIYATSLSEAIKQFVFNAFFMPSTTAYRLSEADFFLGLDRLNLDKDKYVILNFGIDFTFFNQGQKIHGLSEDSYNGVKIHELPFYGRGSDQRLIIIKTTDLPFLTTKDLPQDQIEKYTLEQVSDLKIYASIIDLYRNEAIRNELLEDENTAPEHKVDIEKKVLIYIGILLEVSWKNNVNLITLSIHYSYFSETTPANDLSDINPILPDATATSEEAE